MKKYSAIVILMIGLCLSLFMSACGSASTGNGGPSAPGATSQPTRPKPQSVPTLDMAFCQKILTVAEANSIMKPAAAATAIRIDHGASGGSCNYESAPYKSVVTILFLPFEGQDPQQALNTAATQATNVPNAKVTTTQVSGLGDAALFIAATASAEAITIHQDILDVIYGKLVVSCGNFNAGSSPDSTQLSNLKQVAQLVLSRL